MYEHTLLFNFITHLYAVHKNVFSLYTSTPQFTRFLKSLIYPSSFNTLKTLELSFEQKQEVNDFFALWAFFILANISDKASLKAINPPYQLDFTTPGKEPAIDNSLIFILDRPNFL